MDKITREIFRSWNWPYGEFRTFSQRPTPYNISKTRYISPSSVYRAWNSLFENNYVRKVILLPSDDLVERHLAILAGISTDELEVILSKMEKIYFVEMIHYGHVFHSSGGLKMNENSNVLVAVSFVSSSSQMAERQVKILLDLLDKEAEVLVVPESKGEPLELKDNLMKLAHDLAYQDMYKVDLQQFSLKYNTTTKTLRRRIDSLLSKNVLISYPLLNQSAIRDFNIVVVMLSYDPQSTREAIMDRLKSLNLAGERYLLHRFVNGVLSLLIYYETPGELDQIIYELDSNFKGVTVFTRFRTEVNSQYSPEYATQV